MNRSRDGQMTSPPQTEEIADAGATSSIIVGHHHMNVVGKEHKMVGTNCTMVEPTEILI